MNTALEFGGLEALVHAWQPFKRANSEHLAYLGRSSKVIVATDYGGNHPTSAYEAYSVLLVDYDRCDDWVAMRYEMRQRHLPDMRRMSFKGLGDHKRRRTLIPFLQAASANFGVSLTVLVDKRMQSLFHHSWSELRFSADGRVLWKPRTFERALRVAHIVALLLGEVSTHGQNVFWMSDEDEIVPNALRADDFIGLFGRVSPMYIKHSMGSLKFGTTSLDSGHRAYEDLVSIPDLLCGGLVAALSISPYGAEVPAGGFMAPVNLLFARRAAPIVDWLRLDRGRLRHSVFTVYPDGPDTMGISQVEFVAPPKIGFA